MPAAGRFSSFPTTSSHQRFGSSFISPVYKTYARKKVYNYRLFFYGELASLTGTWMQRLAHAWLVLKLTNSPLALGAVITLQTIPITL